MRTYPVFVDVDRIKCLVAGAGGVGRRKVHLLAATGVRDILVIDPVKENFFAGLPVTYKKKSFEKKDLRGRNLVFAATGNPAVNKKIAALCRKKTILCNVADQPAQGDFITPACCLSSEMTVAICTNGGSPALASRIRQEIGHTILPRYLPMSRLMRRLRPAILACEALSGKEKSILIRRVANSDLPDILLENDPEKAAKALRFLLPAAILRYVAPDGIFHDLS